MLNFKLQAPHLPWGGGFGRAVLSEAQPASLCHCYAKIMEGGVLYMSPEAPEDKEGINLRYLIK